MDSEETLKDRREIELSFHEDAIQSALYWFLDEDGWTVEDLKKYLSETVDQVERDVEQGREDAEDEEEDEIDDDTGDE